MTEDAALYPGSRHTRRAVEAPPAVEETAPTWDAHPVYKTIHGERMALYTVGALAEALGRSAVTMRLWERNGVLPVAKFRLPNRNNVGGRRYYTRPEIEAAIRVADELQMLGQQRRIHPEFTPRLVAAWTAIRKGERASA